MAQPSFLIVSYPLLGAAEVTLVTTVSADSRSKSTATCPPPKGLSFAPFSDGDDGDDGEKSLHSGADYEAYYANLRRRGSQAVATLLARRAYACVIYTPLFHWAADVAAEQGVPAALLWIQAATVFDVNYYYFHGFADVIAENYSSFRSENFDRSLSFPGLPIDLAARDLPSYMVDTSENNWFYSNLVKFLKQQFEKVDGESQRRSNIVLVNTFDALEPEALRAVGDKLSLIAIGPLVQRERRDDRSEIVEWLSSKPAGSVVYVSFGSMAAVSRAQIEEMAKGLLEFGRPFLWVLREKEEEKGVISCQEELDKLGLIVPWCSQVEVLENDALGCFVSHCGWNSTLESLVCGVPIVAVPHFVDQTTNAKLVEDFWKVGVRVKANEEGIVEGGEIKRCLGLVMEGVITTNAKKWKDLAREAAKEGGPLDENLKAFVNEMIEEAR